MRDAFAMPALALPAVLLAAALATTGAVAEPPKLEPVGLEAMGEARAAEAVDGDTLRLADGSSLRLIGIRAPKGAERRFAPQAREELQRIAAGKGLSLYGGGLRRDRRGRILAHAMRADGLWLQAAMLEAGLARVETFADNRARAAEMLAVEAAAREARRGLWSDPDYRVLTAEEALKAADGFQLVEGTVRRVTQRGGKFYLDFGENWRLDFTVAIDGRARPAFRAAGSDPQSLLGARVRVRGWMRRFNGPMIEASHPEQIERLGP